MRLLTPAFVTMGMLGLVGVLIGGYFIKGLLATDEKPAPPAAKFVPMALAELAPGTVITEAHIGQGPIDPAELKKFPDFMINEKKIIGRVVKEAIPAARPIRTSQLYQPGEFPSLQVPEGMRAVSIAVGDSTHLVSGLIKPGQYVDVHLTPTGLERDERAQGGITLTLFKGVKTLAINRGQRLTGAGDRNGNQVTLEVTPRQANVLILAKGHGDLTLTYNPDGEGNGGVLAGTDDRATFDEILGLQPVPKPGPPFTIENYKAAGRSTVQFRDGKRLDMYGGAGTGYGGYGGWGNGNLYQFNMPGLRPAPIWWNSNPNGDNVPVQPNNGDSQNVPPGPSYPSAQNPFLKSASVL